MDAYKKLKSKLKISRLYLIIACVCILLCFISAAIAIIAHDKYAESTDAPYYTSDMTEGSICKIDIVKIDDSFAVENGSGNEYFLCMSTEGQFFVVKMARSVFENSFSEIYSYTLGLVDSAPASVSFSGVLTVMPQELIQLRIQYWGGSNFSDSVGLMYIDSSIKKVNYITPVFIAVSVIFGLVSILAFYIFIKRKLISLKCLKAVFNTGASRHALEEFTDIASKRYGSDNIILGASYIFCPDFGIIYLYSDILWCYAKRTKLYFFTVRKSLVIKDIYANTVSIPLKKIPSSAVDEIMSTIYLNNPECLLGYAKKHNDIYLSRLERFKVKF